MTALDPAVLAWCVVGSFLLILLLGWQVHRERTVAAKAKAELRIYIQASATYATKAMIAEGQRDQCLANF